METLIQLAIDLGDHNILLEATFQLRRPPLDTCKYLYERTRKELAARSYASLKKMFRGRVDALTRAAAASEGAGSTQNRLAFLLEIFQSYQRLKKSGVQPKDEGILMQKLIRFLQLFYLSLKSGFNLANQTLAHGNFLFVKSLMKSCWIKIEKTFFFEEISNGNVLQVVVRVRNNITHTQARAFSGLDFVCRRERFVKLN